MHFTIAVRDRHIRDMVCPVCCEPDINDQEQLDSYFSTLDIQVKVQEEYRALIGQFGHQTFTCSQLRDCLDTEVYELFHKKLTEHALMKDPKFLWCYHVRSSSCLSFSALLSSHIYPFCENTPTFYY